MNLCVVRELVYVTPHCHKAGVKLKACILVDKQLLQLVCDTLMSSCIIFNDSWQVKFLIDMSLLARLKQTLFRTCCSLSLTLLMVADCELL